MAEMTAAEAKQLLRNPFDKKPRLLEVWSDKMNQIAALIQQQAATIEALKLCWNCKFIEADRCNKHNCLVDYPMRDKCDNWQVKEAQ